MTGLSPQRFHAALRIEHAKRLIVETDLSITAICFDVGYNSLGTFVRTFTKLVGITPTQLRQLSKGVESEPVAQSIRSWKRPRAGGALVSAVITSKLEQSRRIAAGLFAQAIPAGLPFDGCFLDPDTCRFTVRMQERASRASLLVVSVGAISLADLWAGNIRDAFVYRHRISKKLLARAKPLPVRLRRLTDVDPPILTPLPLLMMIPPQGAAPLNDDSA